MKNNHRRLRLAAIAGCMLAPSMSSAATVTWTGGNATWIDGDAGNALWNPADEPDADDIAQFDSSDEVAMASDNVVARLEMSARAELNTAGWNLTAADEIRLKAGGGVRLIVDQDSTVSTRAWHVEPAAVLALDGGTLELRDQPGGGQGIITGDAYLRGHGTVAAMGFTSQRVAIINDGILLADQLIGPEWGVKPPGTLTVTGRPLALIDLDGQSEAGIVTVHDNQTLRLELAATDAFSGTINLFVNARFENQHAWTLDGGAIYADNGEDFAANLLTGPSTIAGAPLRQTGGTIHVTDPDGRLDMLADFDMQGGAFVNRGRAVLHGQSRIAAGSTFSGGGTVAVAPTGRLAAAPGVTIGVNLENSGELRPGGDDAIGQLSLQGFQQTRDGELHLELRGSDSASIDRLAVNAPAYLEGLLNIDLDGAFAPTLGQTFEILTSVGGVRGKFQRLDVSDMPDALTFQVLYQPTSVLLQVVSKPDFAADFDGDGDVDRSDLNVWQVAFGQSAAGDADGDLDTDGADFLHWQQQLGSGSFLVNGTPPATAVPEPCLAPVMIAAVALLRRRSI